MDAELFHEHGAPGSDLALSNGCACPVLDNGHGRGVLGNGKLYGWAVNADCPLHGDGSKKNVKDERHEFSL